MRGKGESSDFSGTFVARQQLISSQEILKSGACESTRKYKGARVLKSPSEDPNGSFSFFFFFFFDANTRGSLMKELLADTCLTQETEESTTRLRS